jgi:hypothetical protein
VSVAPTTVWLADVNVEFTLLHCKLHHQ